jgi:hypothetical protein
LENTSPPYGGYQLTSFGGKYMNRRKRKGGKCERKYKIGERKKEKWEPVYF